MSACALAHNRVGLLRLWASSFGEVPHVSGTIIQRPFCPPLQLNLCSSDLRNAEANVSRPSSDFARWDLTLRCLLQASKYLSNGVTSSGT
jgi:hypothetical protein